MTFQKICFYLALCLALLLCPGTSGTDSKPEEGGLNFDPAIQAINAEKGKANNIDYDAFCQAKVDYVNDQLLGCQLKAANTGFELRVCKLDKGM